MCKWHQCPGWFCWAVSGAYVSDPTVRATAPWPDIDTYIGECCQEWVLVRGVPPGHCGKCGEVPTYKREDHPVNTDTITKRANIAIEPAEGSDERARDRAATLRVYTSSISGWLSVCLVRDGVYVAGTRLTLAQTKDLRDTLDQHIANEEAGQ